MEKVSMRFSFVLIALLVVSVALVAFPHPNVAPIVDFIPISSAHNPAHTPVLSPEATTRVDTIVTIWTVQGPPPPENTDIRCVLLKSGETAIRWLIWQKTGLSATGLPRGNLSWFDKLGWEDSYPDKSGVTLTDVPKDLRDNPEISMQEVSCKDFPTLPPMASAQ